MDMTQEELKEKVQLHRKWRLGEPGGVRLDLRGANLTGANLTDAYLADANLTDAYLTRANLAGANLTRANLTGANLTGANLTGANLAGANLTGANLTDAYLADANLTRANLTGANLTDAYLTDAYLADANLTRANLTGANLTGANLPHHFNCPEEGAFIAWKKVRGNVLLRLQVPEDARRVSSLIGRKCRADKLLVLSAEDFDGQPVEVTEFRSLHDVGFVYRVGEMVTVEEFCDDIRQECRPGLHFFVTRREAIQF